jgi:hypothetical protein
MNVCSATPIVDVAQWFAFSDQNTITVRRCSGDIDTEALFLWVNDHLEIAIGLLIVSLVCAALVGVFDNKYAKQPTD